MRRSLFDLGLEIEAGPRCPVVSELERELRDGRAGAARSGRGHFARTPGTDAKVRYAASTLKTGQGETLRSIRAGLLLGGGQTGGRRRPCGRVIPHAQGRVPALAARPLPVAMIEAAFGALAMATARAAQAAATGELGAV